MMPVILSRYASPIAGETIPRSGQVNGRPCLVRQAGRATSDGSATRAVFEAGDVPGSMYVAGACFSRTTPLYGLRSAFTLMISPVRISRFAQCPLGN